MSADLALQGAIVAALKTNSEMIAEFGGAPRIHDRVPDPPVFPYVVIKDIEELNLSTDCQGLWELFATVRVWSRAVGRVEARRIGGIAKGALSVVLPLPAPLVMKEKGAPESTHCIDGDRDGVTTQCIVRVRFLVAGPA